MKIYKTKYFQPNITPNSSSFSDNIISIGIIIISVGA